MKKHVKFILYQIKNKDFWREKKKKDSENLEKNSWLKKKQQIPKLYVLHVMIETTTTADPKIICSAVHLSKKFTQKDTNILLQKKIKERDVSANSSKYIPPKI